MSIDLKGLCTLPWDQLASNPEGDFVYCCEARTAYQNSDMSLERYWNSSYMRSVRKELIKGNMTTHCHTCAVKESKGLHSMRLAGMSRFTPEEFEKNVLYSKNNDGATLVRPKTLDIRFSNKCNMMCRMCYPDNSSSIYQEFLKHREILDFDDDKKNWGRPELGQSKTWNIKELVEFCTHVDYVIISGGEPLLQPEVKELAKELVKSGKSKGVTLQLTTNGSIVDKEFFELLQFFKKVDLLISVDGVGSSYSYIRYPYQWSFIEKNIIKIASHASDKVVVKLTPTIQVLNILSLVELFEWCHKNSIDFEVFTTVMYPDCFAIDILPNELLKEAAQRIDAYVRQNTLTSHQRKDVERLLKSLSVIVDVPSESRPSQLLVKLKKNIVAYDKIRSQSYSDYVDKNLVKLLDSIDENER